MNGTALVAIDADAAPVCLLPVIDDRYRSYSFPLFAGGFHTSSAHAHPQLGTEKLTSASVSNALGLKLGAGQL